MKRSDRISWESVTINEFSMPKIDKFWHRGYPLHWEKCYSWNHSCYFENSKIHVICFISNQTITITLVGKSAFEHVHLFVCLCWGLTSQSTIFQSCRDGANASWVINQYFRGVKCLAQGHNTAAVGFEPPTSRSGVRHSTTEPPRSPLFIYVKVYYWYPLPKWLNFATFLKRFAVNRVTSLRLVVQKNTYSLFEDIYSY